MTGLEDSQRSTHLRKLSCLLGFAHMHVLYFYNHLKLIKQYNVSSMSV